MGGSLIPGETAEIRLLGDWRVHRADGSVVDNREWRTGKTSDLLRLLALDNGHPVRIAALTGLLWPDADEPRARASLRTAVGRIRQVLGPERIRREPDALVLEDCWVDRDVFLDLTGQVQRAVLREEHERVLALVAEADRLYRNDFHAHDDDSTWASLERDRLRHARVQNLADAAESAVVLERYREAVALAGVAVAIDPTCEGPHRSLMRAQAGLGEIGRALKVFASYRQHLADELGAEPSRQTIELHLSLLRGRRPASAASA